MTEVPPPSSPMPDLTRSSVDFVCAYFKRNHVAAGDLPNLIMNVRSALESLSSEAGASTEPLVPAVRVKASIAHDHITCLDCGQKFKSLRRHIYAAHGLTPKIYRARWGLPGDYPMVTEGLSAKRSQLAKAIARR